MPSIGPAEILVILVVTLLVFGPNRMPEIGRQLAKAVREFRRVQQHLSSELQGVVAEFDLGDTAPGAAAAAGGDPVPTLPPKEPPAAGVPAPAPSPTPPPQAEAPGSTGELPPSPPTEPA
jgi:sec-independent protein translocase protein TatA